MDAETGIPTQLTYSEAEPFTPAWSPDSKWIVYISNAGQKFTLRIMPSVGGTSTSVNITAYKWRQPMGLLRVMVEDEHGKPTAARIYLQASDGRAWAPAGAFQRVSVITGDFASVW